MSDEYKAICEKGLNELYSLRTENGELRQRLESRLHEADLVTSEHHVHVIESLVAERKAAEATMRQVAEELRSFTRPGRLGALADRLDPPPVDTEEHDG